MSEALHYGPCRRRPANPPVARGNCGFMWPQLASSAARNKTSWPRPAQVPSTSGRLCDGHVRSTRRCLARLCAANTHTARGVIERGPAGGQTGRREVEKRRGDGPDQIRRAVMDGPFHARSLAARATRNLARPRPPAGFFLFFFGTAASATRWPIDRLSCPPRDSVPSLSVR